MERQGRVRVADVTSGMAARRLRRALAGSTALLSMLALAGAAAILLPMPARADGGTGGAGYTGVSGGAGGTGYSPPSNTGAMGTSSMMSPAGGGGGGGASSGTGGQDGMGGAGGTSGNGLGGVGGAGGTAATPTGGRGADSSNGSAGSGGGGGGGYNGNGAGAPSLANAGTIMGGMGGGGGNGNGGGGGGGGGSGGDGIIVTGATSNTNSGTITGGTGGAGGSGQGAPAFDGQGGGGGVGIQFTTSGATLTNSGMIAGGTGASAMSRGMPGAGGIGVVGAGLTIDNTGGTISGGRANGGNLDQVQAYALQFTGGTSYASVAGTYAGGVNVMAGATFQPGLNTVAPSGAGMNVGGPAVFASTAIYRVRITPTLSDSVTATTATLGGAAVQVLAGTGTYAARRYTILMATSGGLGPANNNTFSGVISNLAFFTTTLSYDANDVFLNIAPNAVGGVNYTTAARTRNQLAVASGLTAASNLAGNNGVIFTALNQLTVPQAQAVFDSLSGEGIAATQNLANRSAQMFGDAIFDQTTFYGGGGTSNQIVLAAPSPGAGFQALAPRSGSNGSVPPGDTLSAAALGLPVRELADLPAARPYIAPVAVAPTRMWRAWGTGFGGQEDVHSNAAIGFAAQSNQIYGGAVGVDYQISPNYLVGVAVGGSDGEFSVPNRATSGSTTGGHVAFYDIARFGAFYGASSTSASFYQNRTTRNVAGFGGLGSETEHGNFASHEFRSRVEFGRDFASPFGGLFGGTLTPFVALEIADLRSNGFGEQAIAGAGLFALNVSGQSAADAPGFVGLRFSSAMALGNGMVFKPVVQAAFVHEFAPYRSQFAAIASLPGATFVVDGARPGRDAAQVKAGGELAIGPRTALFANFDGELSGASQLYGGKGGLKIVF